MSHSQSVLRKYISPQMITSSFTGMIMALPLVFALNSSASRVNTYQAQPAVQNQSTAQVNQADFAKYMYAYDQGYQAHTASVPTGATTTAPNACTDPSSGSGSTDMPPSAPMAMTTSAKMPHAPIAQVVNSYNSFVSTVNNSSTVTNTNSNNTVGSNNVTKTTIHAKELKGVTIDNSQTATQVAAVDSFNTNSYNTKTDTTTISDSFNKQVTKDSGNTITTTDTSNVNNNVTKTIDSNNTTTVTEDSGNTTNTTDTTTNTTTDTSNVTNNVNKTIDSNNTNIDVKLGSGNQGAPHNQSA